jgi:hypothetical protein
LGWLIICQPLEFGECKHEGVWILRNEGHLIDRFPTKKEAMYEIIERQQRIVRHSNWKNSNGSDPDS